MVDSDSCDVVVVGSGPNGLAAAVIMARAGLEVRVYEAQPTIGGGSRTLDLGLAPGVRHDVCSALHPLAAASPFFRAFDLPARVELRYPEVSYAHPLDGGRAGIAYRDLARTVDGLGADGRAWNSLMRPLVERVAGVVDAAMDDHRGLPRDLVAALRLGLVAVEQGSRLWNYRWRRSEAPALFTGVCAHTVTDLPNFAAGGVGAMLGALAHRPGWPVPVGGSQAVTDAMVADLHHHGGVIVPATPISSLGQLPAARAYLLDITPRALLDLAADRLPAAYARALDRFPYGNGVAKVDFVLSGPVPWTNPAVSFAGTVHVGGTRDEMVAAEADVGAGRHPERPLVLVSDPAPFDPGRSVNGLRPLWTYTHVPAGSTVDMGSAVQAQIERFAPGFGDVVVARQTTTAAELSRENANYIAGDISAGAVSAWWMLARPTARWDPYRTPIPGVYLCSSSTPPGPGVHGMGGLHAARRALWDRFGVRRRPALGMSE